MPVGCTEPMAGSHWAGTERCQRRTSVTRRLHRHPPPHAPLPPPRTGRRQVKGDGRGERAEPAPRPRPAPRVGCALLFPGVGTTTSAIPLGFGGDGGWARRDARGATPPARRSRPPPSLRAASAPSTAPFYFFVTCFCDTQLAGTSTCPGRSSSPRSPGSIPGRPRPPLSAPVARDNAIGGNRSFLIPARGKLHPALCCRSPSPPQPARQAAGSGAGWPNFWVTAWGCA